MRFWVRLVKSKVAGYLCVLTLSMSGREVAQVNENCVSV